MFEFLSEAMRERMRHLETLDAADRADGTPHALRLRQIPPATGKFLAILAAMVPAGGWIEVGTSAGYSALWLSLACRAGNVRLTTYEKSGQKAALARETFRLAGVETWVELVEDDALSHLSRLHDLAFCFLDAERSVLGDCFELILPRLVPGGVVAVDNVISHAHEIPEFLAAIETDTRMDSVIVPIGSGLLVSRKPLLG